MRIWTYVRPFSYQDQDYEVKFITWLASYESQLWHNGKLIDKQTFSASSGMGIVEHQFKTQDGTDTVTVHAGFLSWWNLGIEVKQDNALIYASHPGKDIYFLSKKLAKFDGSSDADVAKKQELQAQKWQKNKHSIFADIGLGITFYIVAKVTGDLNLAALVGVVLGLSLVVIQRFVKIDLLGGFAVFGTIMLMISGILSLIFQDPYFVQLKGTIMGLIGASVFLTDGVFRQGRYFGNRFERYFNSAIDKQFFIIGLGIIGLVMASANYLVATYLSEDTWLTYKTFIDDPINFILFITLLWQATKRASKVNQLDTVKIEADSDMKS